MINQLFYILLVIQTLVLGFLGLIYELEAWDITSFGSAYLHTSPDFQLEDWVLFFIKSSFQLERGMDKESY